MKLIVSISEASCYVDCNQTTSSRDNISSVTLKMNLAKSSDLLDE